MDSEDAAAVRQGLIDMLVKHKNLCLRVSVDNEEQAEEIMKWMYASDKPMKAELLEVAWDKVLVSADVGDAISAIQMSPSGG